MCSSKPFVCLHLCFSYNLFLFQFHRTDKHFVANATCAQVQDNTDCDSGKIQQRKKTPNFFENSKWSRLLFTQKRIHSQIPSRIHWKRHWNQHESFTVILFTINMEIDMQINYQLQLDHSHTHIYTLRNKNSIVIQIWHIAYRNQSIKTWISASRL